MEIEKHTITHISQKSSKIHLINVEITEQNKLKYTIQIIIKENGNFITETFIHPDELNDDATEWLSLFMDKDLSLIGVKDSFTEEDFHLIMDEMFLTRLTNG